MNLAEVLFDVGIVRIPDSIEAETCADILRQVRESTDSVPTGFIELETMRSIRDPKVRRGRQVRVSPETSQVVRSHVEAVLPLVAARFRKPLASVQEPTFMRYDPGDFYAFHRDAAGTADEPEELRALKVSWVLFLNEERASEDAPGYEGGALQFWAHDLVAAPAYAETALSIHGRTGLFVAFEPTVLHRVTPVLGGERFTVVGGYA